MKNGDHRGKCGEMNRYRKIKRRIIPVEKIWDDYKVTGTAYGKKFSDALNNT